MAIESSLKTWVSDKLMSLAEYSAAVVTQYIIKLSEMSSSPNDLMTKLVEYGLPCSVDTSAFAREVFDRVPHRQLGGGSSRYEQQERKTVQLAKKQREYKLISDAADGSRSDTREGGDGGARRKRFRKTGGSKADDEEVIKKLSGHEDIDYANLRKVSRQAYLKKRRDQKLLEVRDEIIGDEYIFGACKRTEAEERELRRKKEVLRLSMRT